MYQIQVGDLGEWVNLYLPQQLKSWADRVLGELQAANPDREYRILEIVTVARVIEPVMVCGRGSEVA